MSESDNKAALAYPRLCLAYFCQFAIWGAWAGALGGYTGGILHYSGGNIGWLYNAFPIGAVIAPLFIGPIADRYFASQKVLGFLHFISGLALLACGYLCQTGQQSFYIILGLLLLSGMCYTPTLGLMNSVVFKHLPKPSMGPYVFVFGTIGWIVVNLFIAAFCDGANTPGFFFVGGAVSLFLALYSFTLPNTPPKGAPAPGEKSDVFGLGALSLFKDWSFAIFVLCAFCASIPACNFFFPVQISYLGERGYPSPVGMSTINQFSEIIFMLALPFFIPRIGLKNVLLIGMAAWGLRYVCFAQPEFHWAFVGLLLHGFCYSFLYVASYMYAEKVAPANLKASAQSMMIFLLIGVGQVLGGLSSGYLVDANKAQFASMPSASAESKEVAIPAWSAEGSMLQYLDLGAQVDKLLKREKPAQFDLGKLVGNKPLTATAIDALPDDAFAKAGFSKDDLKAFAEKVAGKADYSLSRDNWFAAQAHNWNRIFTIPAAFIGVFFLIFLVLGKNPVDKQEETEAVEK